MLPHILCPLLITIRHCVNYPDIFEWLFERKGTCRRHRNRLELIAEHVQIDDLDIIGIHHLVVAVHGVYSLTYGGVYTDVLQHSITVQISDCTWENT